MFPLRVPAAIVFALVATTASSPAVATENLLESITSPAPQIVEMELARAAEMTALTLPEPDRFVLDLLDVVVRSGGALEVAGEGSKGSIESVRWDQSVAGSVPATRVVLDLDSPVPVQIFESILENGGRLLRMTTSSTPGSSSKLEWQMLALEIRGRASMNDTDVTKPAPRRPLVVPTEPLGWDAPTGQDFRDTELVEGASRTPRRPIAAGPDVTVEESTQATNMNAIEVQNDSTTIDDPEAEPTGEPVSLAEELVSPDVAPTVTAKDIATDDDLGETTTPAQDPETSDVDDQAAQTPAERGFWLIRTDGARIELSEPWRIEGRRVIYTPSRGVLASMRLSDVDLELSSPGTQP